MIFGTICSIIDDDGQPLPKENLDIFTSCFAISKFDTVLATDFLLRTEYTSYI